MQNHSFDRLYTFSNSIDTQYYDNCVIAPQKRRHRRVYESIAIEDVPN